MDTKRWISSSLASLFTRDCRVNLVSLIRRLIQGLRSTVVSAAGALLCFALFGVTHPAYSTPIDGEWGAYENGYIHNDAVCGFTQGIPNCLLPPCGPGIDPFRCNSLDPRLHPLSDGYFVGTQPLNDAPKVSFAEGAATSGDSVSHALANLATGELAIHVDTHCCYGSNLNPLPTFAIARIFDTLVFSGAQPGAHGTVHMSGLKNIDPITGLPVAGGTNEAGASIEVIPGQRNAAATTPFLGIMPDGPWSLSQTFSIQNGVLTEFIFTLDGFVTHCTLCSPLSSGGELFFEDPISFDLPAGVTFESASGVFLTGATVSVPEPATLVILGLGLAGLGFSRRKRE